MTERYLLAGPYRLDLREERLWQGDSPVRLGGKAIALLRALMENPHALVTKVQLFERVWPGLTVSDGVLTTAVKELRHALGDDARHPSVIETVHGRGYRFLLPVERRQDFTVLEPERPSAPPEDRARAPRPRWIAIGLVGAAAGAVAALAWFAARSVEPPAPPVAAAAVAHPKSIAVLPFADMSSDGSRKWFADGLTEEILNSLARTPDLRVASRTSSVQVSRAEMDVLQAARALGVANVLEGSVRRSGGRVRVTAQLIRGSDGFHLWSQNYDRAESDVISIQEEIAFDIARALKTVLQPEQLRAMVESGTRSVDAYEAYLQGLAADQRQLAEGDLAHAQDAAEAYERARTLDPQFAAAHWKAALTWYGNATRVDSELRGAIDESERSRRFFERVDAAIASSHDRTDTLKYRAFSAAMRMRLREAQRLMAQYVRERPRDIDAWEEMADISAWAGERDAVRTAAERVHTLSMQGGEPRSRAITLSVMALDLEAAAQRAQRQLELRPGNALTQYQAHRAFLWSGRTTQASGVLDRIRQSDLPEEVRILAELRQACAEGRRADAVRWKARLAGADVSTRWRGEHIIGNTAAANALLRPYDRPERLPILIQFAIDPTFDSAGYPVLSAALVRDGVTLPRPIREPSACRARA